ncbi:MAG: FtsB family cell division protein [Bacillota bacterium]
MYPAPRFHSLTPQNPAPVKRRRRVITWRLKPGFLLCLAILGYVVFSLGHLELKIRQIEREIAFQQQQKEVLLLENQGLREQKQKMNSRSYIEKVAREELGLIYPGEKVFMRGQPGNALPLAPANPADVGD